MINIKKMNIESNIELIVNANNLFKLKADKRKGPTEGSDISDFPPKPTIEPDPDKKLPPEEKPEIKDSEIISEIDSDKYRSDLMQINEITNNICL